MVAARPVRLRALGLDTANLKSVTLISPAYLQVLEVGEYTRGSSPVASRDREHARAVVGIAVLCTPRHYCCMCCCLC